MFHTDGVAVGGSWTPTIVAAEWRYFGTSLVLGIDVVEQEPETCEINLFGIAIEITILRLP